MSDAVALSILRAAQNTNNPEVELALVQCDGNCIVVTLDDGERLTFDAIEIRTAIGGDHPEQRAAA